MLVKKLFLFLVLITSVIGYAQIPELSPVSKISLLTVGTADELHSKFGHTAIRIKDSATDLDIVFGYGGFDFETPFFYWKFSRGKLDYSMTGHRFPNFIASYRQENRWVREQELNLSLTERNQLLRFLENNYRSENRDYKYDFLFDNCATKIPEVFKGVFGNSLDFDDGYLMENSTFRELIHENLDSNSWSAFGIDLALGAVIDRNATAWEHQFLPSYVYQQFDNTKINGKELVIREELLLDAKPIEKSNYFFLTPLFWLITLMVAVIIITYFDQKKMTRTKRLDFLLFLTTGIAGLLIGFLWFATDHTSTKMNFNILWSMPLNSVVAFAMLRQKKLPEWIITYLWILLGLIVVTALLWLFKVQLFSPLVIFILVALGVRYLFLIQYLKHSNSKTI